MSVLRFLSKNVEPSSVHSDCNFFRDKFCHSVEARCENFFPPAYSKFIYRKLILCQVEEYVEYCL